MKEWLKETKKRVGRTSSKGPDSIDDTKLRKALKKAKSWSAPGPDGIHTFWWKALPSAQSALADVLWRVVSGDLALSISDIYPKELNLKKTNTSPKKSPFLDLDITITNNQFITKVYDKREDFNFDIVNFPHLDSNIPKTPAYGVFISQLIRYSRICSDFSSFQAKRLQLCSRLSRLIKQGYKYFKIKSTFKTFLSRQPLVRIKYKQKVASMLKDCLVLPHIVLSHLQRNVTTRRPKGRLT